MQSFGWRIAISLGAINLYISHVTKMRIVESSGFKPKQKVGIDIHEVLRLALRFRTQHNYFFGFIFANHDFSATFNQRYVLANSDPDCSKYSGCSLLP